jgi:hypothetical protein
MQNYMKILIMFNFGWKYYPVGALKRVILRISKYFSYNCEKLTKSYKNKIYWKVTNVL